MIDNFLFSAADIEVELRNNVSERSNKDIVFASIQENQLLL